MRKQKFDGLTLRVSRTSVQLYVLCLDAAIPEVTSRIPVDTRIHDTTLELMNTPKAVVEERILNGDQMLVAYHKGEPISYLFAATNENWVEELQDTLIIKPNEIYLYDAFTKPAYRGQHVYPLLLTHAALHFRALTYSRALIFVKNKNIPSIRSIERAGFQCYRTIDFHCLFGYKLWRYNRATKDVKSHFENETE